MSSSFFWVKHFTNEEEMANALLTTTSTQTDSDEDSDGMSRFCLVAIS